MTDIRLCLVLAILAAGTVGETAAQTAAVEGLIVDASGAAVPDATVILQHRELPGKQVASGPDGRFVLRDVAVGEYTIRVIAAGFAEASIVIRVGPALADPVTVAVQPAAFSDVVTVTASRGAARLETPASTSVLTSAELLNSAPVTIDEALRNTPGFSLFRRSSSRTSTPPTQGVTLRGIAGSGASRTLVLADGLPLNDPFGSWVYWHRVPLVAIERVEVVRGASGDLYGADALGGVVQVLTFTPGRPRLRAVAEAASFATYRTSLFGSGQIGKWTGGLAGEWQDTAGVVRIPEDQRGPVDIPMTSDYRSGFATIGYARGTWRAHTRVAAAVEDRVRGTALLADDTTWRQFSGEASGTAAGGAWLARAAGGTQEFFNNFSSISSDRTTERVTREQTIPTGFGNVSGQYVRSMGRHALLIGAEGKRTKSTVQEIRFSPAGTRTGPFWFGGTEVSGSIFGRASIVAADAVTIMLSARGDLWRSTPLDTSLPSKAIQFFSPNASVAWRAAEGVTLRAAAYQAFRTPTLNELHRGFRVGDVVTDGNPLLDTERLVGGEGGVLLARGRLSTRLTAFWNQVDNLVANITLQITPQLITRQKQNADTARAAGLELETDFRVSPRLTLNGMAAFTGSHFVDTPKQPALDGKRVPQVPFYQIGAGISYAAPDTITASAQLRVTGAQYEDDRNEFELGAYAVVDAYVSRALRRGTQIFVAVENVFDVEYDVGRTPLRTIGWPRTVRGGLRLFLP